MIILEMTESNMDVNNFIFEGVENVAVDIHNNGNLPTSCIVRIEGLTNTPTFRILQNGKIIDQARYYLTIKANEFLIINSNAENQEATYHKNVSSEEVVEDVYYLGDKDYTFSNFITIPSGESKFIISGANGQLGKVTLSYSVQRELI